MSTKMGYSICSICDIGCQVRTEATGGKVTRVIAHAKPLLAKNICFKNQNITNHMWGYCIVGKNNRSAPGAYPDWRIFAKNEAQW